MAIDPRRIVKNPGELLKGLQLLRDDVAEFETESIPEKPGFLWRLVHLNPALYRGLVVAVVLILGAFGLAASDHQTAAIVDAVSAVVAIVQALWTRTAVTANKKVVVLKPDPVNEPSVVAPGEAVSTNGLAILNAAAENSATGKAVLKISDLPPVV